MPKPSLSEAQKAKLAEKCLPELDELLASHPESAPLGHAHLMQFPGGSVIAQALLTLVVQYGPAVAQEALDLIESELQSFIAPSPSSP